MKNPFHKYTENFGYKVLWELITKTHIDRLLSDKLYLKIQYRRILREKLNIDNPKKFNEKLQWLKLYNRRPEYTTMVDKYAVKDYVAKIIGEQYIIPTLGVWEKPEDIDWDKLPNQFVLKCTHDSGGLVICRNKVDLDKEAAKDKLRKCLRKNYYWAGREWPYKNVPPRIIAEKYMEVAPEVGDLPDFKVFNFNGEPKLVEIDYNRFVSHMRNIYTIDWEKTDIKIDFPSDDNKVFNKPEVMDELKDLCRRLSAGIPFVRSDFYIVDNKLFFGELTFFPDAGYVHLTPEEYQKKLGDWIVLPTGKPKY